MDRVRWHDGHHTVGYVVHELTVEQAYDRGTERCIQALGRLPLACQSAEILLWVTDGFYRELRDLW